MTTLEGISCQKDLRDLEFRIHTFSILIYQNKTSFNVIDKDWDAQFYITCASYLLIILIYRISTYLIIIVYIHVKEFSILSLLSSESVL